jgi:prevent-host-death family protein
MDLVGDLVGWYHHLMIEVGVHEAKTTLSRLLRLVATGEEVVITRDGRAVARLVPVREDGPRRLGEDRGRYVVPDDFDDDLPDDVLRTFEP